VLLIVLVLVLEYNSSLRARAQLFEHQEGVWRMTQPYFDHEKLHVYQKAIRFVAFADHLLEQASKKAAVRDQLETVLNVIVDALRRLGGGWRGGMTKVDEAIQRRQANEARRDPDPQGAASTFKTVS